MTAPTPREVRDYPCIWCGISLDECWDGHRCCELSDHPYATAREAIQSIRANEDDALTRREPLDVERLAMAELRLLDTYIIRCGDPAMGAPTWQEASAALHNVRAALIRREPLDVEVLAEAMDAADPPISGDEDDEDRAEHRAYAKVLAAEYARLEAER